MKYFLIVIAIGNGQYNYQRRIGLDWYTPLEYEMFHLRSKLVHMMRNNRLRFIGRAKVYEIVNEPVIGKQLAEELHDIISERYEYPEEVHPSIHDIL